MADKHPYVPTQSYLVQVINHLRRSLPPVVTADTLKKLGFAPNNESYVLNVIRFLGIIDQEGNKTDLASSIFLLHDDASFSVELSKAVSSAYADLFQLHGEDAWTLNADALITFFRQSDQTTAVVGKLQASTFQLLATLSGKREAPKPKTTAPRPSAGVAKPKATITKGPSTVGTQSTQEQAPPSRTGTIGDRTLGLTVRIEINLPASGDQETYDRIFKSIRENLLNG